MKRDRVAEGLDDPGREQQAEAANAAVGAVAVAIEPELARRSAAVATAIPFATLRDAMDGQCWS